MEIVLIVIFLIIFIVYFIPKLIKGLKGVKYGSTFIKHYGEVNVKSIGIFHQKIAISHVKESEDDKIGIDFITTEKQTLFKQTSSRPFTMSKKDTKELINLLSLAISEL